MVELLAAQPFLKGLTEHQLGLLAPLAHQSMFHAGNRVFHEGSPADRFWILTDGRVELDTEVPGYENLVIETLEAGSVLGWSWMFPPYRWHFGATAVATTYTLTFSGALVTALCRRDPALGYDLSMRFLQVMGDRLQTTRMRLARFHRNVGRRTAGMPAGRPRPDTDR
jgi:CRP/FNR family transcriptional regulator, cyclic AMP receptor protein